VLTIFPQTEIHIDADRIEKLEILSLDGRRVEVRVHTVEAANAQLFAFEDKTAAINFCRKLWQRRGRKNLEGGRFILRLAEVGSKVP
jgi:hypothetical protein